MYVPTQVPSDPKAIPQFLMSELRRISEGTATPFTQLDVLHKAPDKPRDGMVAFADGTDWDPGSGAGFYGYRAGVWRILE